MQITLGYKGQWYRPEQDLAPGTATIPGTDTTLNLNFRTEVFKVGGWIAGIAFKF